ncbi:hypothetical protein [Flavobacterium foetidum]|uniref:hypothetical protein n=1 Tax=Flavobacterium foetidum TaxID=2026681 RepID=UPI001075597E|nr:hypothetical protein [Flavobacterium foetidum]KAF2510549.1 hypothetical protein E0W73_17615 [Flavobacterium foetidum]
MKRKLVFYSTALLSFLFLITSLISCSSDGADGADGAEGVAGPPGPAGPAGPKGDNGTGSVIYSGWLDVTFTPETETLADGSTKIVGYFASINVPKLTKELLSTADIKVYINTSSESDPGIYPLPYVNLNGAYIDVFATTQKIELYSSIDVGTRTLGAAKVQQYRYMIIPGNVTAKSNSKVDWSDYKAVKAHLGLND